MPIDTAGGRSATKFYVQTPGARPDFRLLLSFVWGEADCDTDGNSDHPASQDWTELYAQNRSRPDETFDINPVVDVPLVLEVESKHEWLAAAVAYLLAYTTEGAIADLPTGPY